MIDFIIPAYCEYPEAIKATVIACLGQSYKIGTIFVIDDGSPKPITLPQSLRDKVRLIRLPENKGISAARNVAIKISEAEWIACVNVEVIPQQDWLETNMHYLMQHQDVGVTFTRTAPLHPYSLLARWRLRFQEAKYPGQSGPVPFAMGHAVLFRREALDAVGGYDEQYRRIAEDGDICARMRQKGWETHYIAESGCRSIQNDTLSFLAKKELIRGGWVPGEVFSFRSLCSKQTRRLVQRLLRNIVSGRLLFIPIDFAVWGYGLLLAASAKKAAVVT